MRFTDVLASSVHDIKNSLGMLINTLEELASDPASSLADDPRAVRLQLEARRANSELVQLLTLYKLDHDRLTPHLAEHNLEDYLDEIRADNQTLAQAAGITLECECDPYLSAYFDEELVRNVLNSAVGNAKRYTQDHILLSAEAVDDYRVIRVEDNGSGFPPAMLALQEAPDADTNRRDRTRLGLFFSRQVAELHQNGGRRGFVRLENGRKLPGSCFSLWLP